MTQDDYYYLLPFEIKQTIDEQTAEIQSLFSARSKANAQIGFNMLKIMEEESYKGLGYKTARDYIEDRYQKAYSTVNTLVKNCRKYKELELDPKKINNISLYNFGQMIKLVDKNIITEDEFKKDYFPKLDEKSESYISGIGVKKLVDSKLKSEGVSTPSVNVDFKEKEADSFRENVSAIKDFVEFEGSSRAKIINIALGQLVSNLANGESLGFSHAYTLLNSLNTILMPGLCMVPVVYNKDMFNHTVDKLAEQLPKKSSEDLSYQIEIRDFIDKIKQMKTFAIPQGEQIELRIGEQGNQGKEIIIDPRILPDNLHSSWDPQKMIELGQKDLVNKHVTPKTKSEPKKEPEKEAKKDPEKAEEEESPKDKPVKKGKPSKPKKSKKVAKSEKPEKDTTNEQDDKEQELKDSLKKIRPIISKKVPYSVMLRELMDYYNSVPGALKLNPLQSTKFYGAIREAFQQSSQKYGIAIMGNESMSKEDYKTRLSLLKHTCTLVEKSYGV